MVENFYGVHFVGRVPTVEKLCIQFPVHNSMNEYNELKRHSLNTFMLCTDYRET